MRKLLFKWPTLLAFGCECCTLGLLEWLFGQVLRCRQQFDQFLGSVRDCTTFLEFRVDNRLIGCAVVDVLPNALSAIYTYFDPVHSSRSLGTLAVLRQVALANELGLKYLYLGYWIADCQKMRYKTNYRPLELLRENAWKICE